MILDMLGVFFYLEELHMLLVCISNSFENQTVTGTPFLKATWKQTVLVHDFCFLLRNLYMQYANHSKSIVEYPVDWETIRLNHEVLDTDKHTLHHTYSPPIPVDKLHSMVVSGSPKRW